MKNVNPYLNFNGRCEEAFRFYKSVFGGEFSSVMRYKEIPQSEEKMPEEEAERIMHMSLPIGGGIVLMGSDISEKMGQKMINGNNVHISLEPDGKKEAEQIYEKLSAGGSIEMPFGKMFWGDWYASFTDRFGIPWMINCED